MRRLSLPAVFVLVSAMPSPAQSDAWYAAAVKSLEATCEPAAAAPGQTVTFRVTIDLNPGYRTYPTVQPDKKAEQQVNTFKFPDAGDLIFVGTIVEPPNPETHEEPLIGIKELRYYVGKVVYERKAVVSPKAKAGEMAVTLKSLVLNVCDSKGKCYPTKTLTPTAKLTVKGDPMAVDKQFQAEVEKAISGK